MDFFSWITSSRARAAADLIFSGGELNPADAREVVYLLHDDSEQHIRNRVGNKFYDEYFPTNRYGGNWGYKAPTGWVDHYTAGISAESTLKWFSKRDRGVGIRNSCAHFVIDHDGTTMVLVDPLSNVTWHATWANPTHIGAEHVNAGLLTKNEDGGLVYGEKNLYPVKDGVPVQLIDGEVWEPYTTAQIAANIFLKRLLYLTLPNMDEAKFVDHQEIDPERKRDCGPLWPLHTLNHLVFSWENAHQVDVLSGETVLTADGVARFKSEVRDLTAKTPRVS